MEKVIVYGAGIWGKETVKVLKSFGIIPYCILDKDANLENRDIDGIHIYSLENVSDTILSEAILLIAIRQKDRVVKDIENVICKEKIWILDYLYRIICLKHNTNSIASNERISKLSPTEGICLFIDQNIARYDMNAGHRSSLAYLKVLQTKYENIVYMINDLSPLDFKYVNTYLDMGIHILIDFKNRCENVKLNFEFVEVNADKIKYVFINRPNIANIYVDFIKEKTRAKIVVYGHDLHFLRLYRQYEVTNDKEALKESDMYKQIEMNLPYKVDLVGYPSNIEVEMLSELVSSDNIKYFPLWFYEDIDFPKINTNPENSILFVGGFNHSPNRDGIVWFVKKVLPHLRAKGIDVDIYIVGSNPTKDIIQLQGDNVHVTGYVSDEELKRLYNMCKMAILPLRYGAGMKGKLLEALCYGKAVISTSVGIEGLIGVEKFVYVADSEIEFSKAIHKIMHLSNEEYSILCSQAQNYIRNNFSKEIIVDTLELT